MKEYLSLRSGRHIGEGHPCYVIAEIGSNHNGSLEKAKKLIKLAKECGADAAKFQSFDVKTLISEEQLVDGRWKKHAAWKLLEKLSIPLEWHAKLAAYAKKLGIDFLSTPFDEERVALLAKLHVPLIKIASGDLISPRLLHAAAKTKIPIVLSTGAATLGEVEVSLKLLEDHQAEQVALLHCVSMYPPTFDEVNLNAMATLKQAFKRPVGFSDHTLGFTISLAAVAMGASILEKHFTDDRHQSGPDHPHSLNPEEFAAMVLQIRQIEAAFGSGIKLPVARESEERVMARRALYVSQAVPKGKTITSKMLKAVRHAYPEGIHAWQEEMVIGRKAKDDLAVGQLLRWDHLC